MSLKDILGIGIATEKNNYEYDTEDEIWVRDAKGNFILIGGESHEDVKE